MKIKALVVFVVLVVVFGIGAWRMTASAQTATGPAPSLAGLLSQGFEIKAVITLPLAGKTETVIMIYLQNRTQAYFCRDNPVLFCGKLN
jgi:hypothetical protein